MEKYGALEIITPRIDRYKIQLLHRFWLQHDLCEVRRNDICFRSWKLKLLALALGLAIALVLTLTTDQDLGDMLALFLRRRMAGSMGPRPVGDHNMSWS